MKPLICFLIIPVLMIGCAEQESSIEVPEPYYNDMPQKYGVENLQAYLEQWEWIEDYAPHKFDCSEMSALLEYKLENEGFHTTIVLGQHEGIGHSWLEVKMIPMPSRDIWDAMTPSERLQSGIKQKQACVIVEATTLSVITRDDPEYKKYSRPTQIFSTIYDAMKVSPSAFDWWNK